MRAANVIRMLVGDTPGHMIGHSLDGRRYEFQHLVFATSEVLRMCPIEFNELTKTTSPERIEFRFTRGDSAMIREVNSELTSGGKVEFTIR